MRTSQILSLAALSASTSAIQIGFGITTDSCGDGFYIGCFGREIGDCCSLSDSRGAQSVSFGIYSSTASVIGKVYSAADCPANSLLAEQASSGVTNFCVPKLSGVFSAHVENGSTSGKKKRGGNRAKECRAVDTLIYPGGERADISGLEERELDQIIDMIVARGDVAAVEAQLVAFRK